MIYRVVRGHASGKAIISMSKNKEPPTVLEISKVLSDNAKLIFHGSAQVRALQDVWIKARFISSLFEVAIKISLDLSRAKILDVGCSKCDVLLAMQKLGINNLTGINLFEYDLEWLSNKIYFTRFFGNSVGKIKYIVSDVDKDPIPFKDSSFNVILLLDTIEHLHDPEKVLKESYRVLCRGGIIVISTSNVANLRNRVRLLLGKSIYYPLNEWLSESQRINDNGFRRFIGHVREYTMEELEFMLKKNGFNDILLKRYFASHIQRDSISYRLYNFLETLYPRFRYHMLIIARKPM